MHQKLSATHFGDNRTLKKKKKVDGLSTVTVLGLVQSSPVK